MRRRAKMQRAQQMAKLRLPVFRADAESLEHFVLQLRLVNSHAATADFDAVKDDVVGLGANVREFLCFKQRHVLRFRSRERMMHRVPLVLFRAPFKQRKICHPKEIPDFSGGRELLYFGDAQPQSAKNFARDLPFVCGEKGAVTFLDIESRLQRLLFGLREKFHDGRFPLAVLDLNKGESLRAVQFCNFSELVSLSNRDSCKALRVDCFHYATCIERGTKNFETAFAEDFA